MAILLIEMYEEWFKLETIPITRKTNSEILKRIPAGKTWRMIYLNHIIKNPKMSIQEWGNIPSLIVSIIYDCIDDFLEEYEVENKMLNSVINVIETRSLDDKSFDYFTELRNSLLKSIEEKENDKKLFKYSKDRIKNIRNKDKKNSFTKIEMFKKYL